MGVEAGRGRADADTEGKVDEGEEVGDGADEVERGMFIAMVLPV